MSRRRHGGAAAVVVMHVRDLPWQRALIDFNLAYALLIACFCQLAPAHLGEQLCRRLHGKVAPGSTGAVPAASAPLLGPVPEALEWLRTFTNTECWTPAGGLWCTQPSTSPSGVSGQQPRQVQVTLQQNLQQPRCTATAPLLAAANSVHHGLRQQRRAAWEALGRM